MVHAGAVCSGFTIMLALPGRQCTWTTALLAYGAADSQIKLGSSIRAKLHYRACRIIEYYA